MAPRRRLHQVATGGRARRRTARFRLTALYCCLFLPSGVALCVLTYVVIVLAQTPTHVAAPSADVSGTFHGGVPPQSTSTVAGTTVTVAGLSLDPREFVIGSCIVLVALIGLSVVLGWLGAGRVLRPLRVMTATTQQISERNLSERLALTGPDDELKSLGDTIDGLLTRLESAFDSQRRFVANASHELRTPLMLSQTVLQVALADPDSTVDSLRAACQDAIDAGKDQAQLIDALLILARSQRGLDHQEPMDLRGVVSAAVSVHEASAAAKGLDVDVRLDDVRASGDSRLVHRLVSNLLDNAIRYNMPGGRVDVTLAAGTSGATLSVVNTGPPVPPHQVERLLEPFQRAVPDRTAPSGFGLGLSIVAEIAAVHHASLVVLPRPEGGLTVTVSFPAEGP